MWISIDNTAFYTTIKIVVFLILPTVLQYIFLLAGDSMSWDYSKLSKVLIDKKMTREDLLRAAKTSTNVYAKFKKGEPISMIVLGRICNVLKCNVGDIVDWIHEEEE